MDPISILKLVVSRLERLKIPYMLTGGLAVSFWGLPRTTHDVDIIIEAEREDKEKIVDTFKKDFYISKEAVSEAIEKKFTFNIIHFKSSLKVDFWLIKKDPYKILEFERRKKEKIFGKKIYIISPEDLILIKLFWYREGGSSRHLEDIKSILVIQKSKLDLNYIKNWARRQSTVEILENILKKK